MPLLRVIWAVVRALVSKNANLVAENLAVRQQLIVLRKGCIKLFRPIDLPVCSPASCHFQIELVLLYAVWFRWTTTGVRNNPLPCGRVSLRGKGTSSWSYSTDLCVSLDPTEI